MLNRLFAVLVLVFAVSGAATAAPMYAGDVDADEFITFGGLQWAWASPCDGDQVSCAEDITLHDGWRIPTVEEFNARPSASAFQVGDNGIACASGWFQGDHSHCDFGDADRDLLWHPLIAGREDNYNWETWLVRSDVNEVPEPATLALFGAGLLGLGVMRRRRRA